jgi:hypothetical protein
MTYAPLRHAFEESDVKTMISNLWAGRVVFHGGDPEWGGKGTGLVTPSGAILEDEIIPGVSVHKIGGHTGGLQSVRVSTARCVSSERTSI